GALSLAHAFAYAGCPSVLMSLWPVDDQSTQQLMRGFYQGLGDGLNKSEALRQARQAYLAQHDLSHPYYWGAFVMIGDDQSLQLPFSFWNWWWLLPLIGGLLIFWKTQFRQS
ncbi:MAG: CHAT domain-containing protein, partial [Bacteroidota bacterium]